MSTLEGGQRVGRYQIVRFLGAGAMGEVYLAEDPHIERRLAIKTVRLAGGRPQDIEDRKKRLLREARAAGRLLHPNVVALFDAGEEDGVLFLAFEFVEGCDLASRLESSEPPSLREVLRIVRQVAEALDYAHRQGIVHRDIKPSNILIDVAGHVKVADFGIAKVAGQNTELTLVGSVMGSPQYLSPEQIRGDELDGRSDIFSLGVVLYELLSGRRPFDGETITTLVYQILHKDPSISELRAVPLRIEQLLHHMLAKDREQRLGTAGLVAEELAAIERELPEETLAAPAAPAPMGWDATRVLPSRANAPAPSGSPAGTASPPPATASTAPASPFRAVPPGSGSQLGAIGGASTSGAAGASGVSGTAGAGGSLAASVPAQRSSSARIWLALAALLVVLCGGLAVGAYWFWQRYLQPALPASNATATPPTNAAIPSNGATAAPPTNAAAGMNGATATNGAAAANTAITAPGSTPALSAAPGRPANPANGTTSTGPGTTQVPPAAAAGAAKPQSSIAISRPGPEAAAGGRSDKAVAARGDTGSTRIATSTAADGEARDRLAGADARDSSAATARKERPLPVVSAPATDSGAGRMAPAREPESEPQAPAVAADSADRVLHSGMELAFRVNPADAFVLLDGAVIGKAQEWSGQKGGRSFTLPGAGAHVVKIKRPGMRDYRIAVEASATRGVTQVVVNLQPLPAAQVDTPDLQTIRVREAVALHVQPDVDAVVLVDGSTVGPVKKFAGRFGRPDEWLSLPLGTHRLTLIAPGYGRRDLAVEVTPGADRARQKIDVPLVREAGN